MKHPIAFRREVEADVEQAFLWYESQRQGLGFEFLDALKQAYREIQRELLTYPEIQRRVRKGRVARFPYRIYYRFHQEQVTVLGVFHAARQPDLWKQRA